MMRMYHCVDMLNPQYPEDIEANSPDAAMKQYFKNRGISESPVRSVKQAHKKENDYRFYTKTNHDNNSYRARQVIIGFNRKGFEFYGCTHNEFDESLGKDLAWSECGNL